MGDNLKKKKHETIDLLRKTKKNLSASKENINQHREEMEVTVETINDQHEHAEKTIYLLETLPDESLEERDPKLDSLVTSINAMATSGLTYSENLDRKSVV